MTALSLPRSELPEEIEKAIWAFDDEAWSMGAGVGFRHKYEEARSALTAAILSRLGEAEAEREEWEQAAKVEASQRRHALAHVQRLEKALEDLKDAFHEDSDAYAKISAALSSPAATEEG